MSFLASHRAFLVLLFGALFLLPFGANEYYLFIANMIMIYMILALGLNILIGFAGQLAFANAAMFGIGAYGAGLLMKHFAIPYFAAAPLGALIAMAVGTLLALPALRLSGIYLALTTLAFAQFAFWVMTHWTSVTFGAGGFVPPAISFAPISDSSELPMYYLTWISVIVLLLVAWRAMASPIGRAFVAIRDREVAAQSLGVDLFRYKALAFAFSGFYAGAAGALYCGILGFVGPESFDLLQMVMHKAAVVLGGIGSIMGSILGGAMIVVILEGVKEIEFSIEIAFGGMLLVFVLFQPNGLVVYIQRWLPGWREKLHYDPTGADAGLADAGAAMRDADDAPKAAVAAATAPLASKGGEG